MLKNYFKIAWRTLVKDKMHSTINILGLSLGMAIAILISLWMYDELSFDKNFDNYDHIAQVYQNLDNNGERATWRNVPYPLANELRTNYGSDFKHIVMAVNWNDHVLTINDKKLKQTGGFFEKEMPEMFSLQMQQGTRSLAEPTGVLLSASAAKAYFGGDDPLNKIIRIDQMPPVKVTGVYKDFPLNSTLAGLNFVASWDFWYNTNNKLADMEDPWRPNFTTLFVQLNDNANINSVNARIKDAKLKKLNAHLVQKKPSLFLHPMSKWHLYSEFKEGVNVGGAIQYVWMFGIIGVFVLLLACINFMNLSTAKSEKRAKEVGIRKAIGSERRQLIMQFFSESILIVCFAFLFSLIFVQLALPFFNQIADKQMAMPWLNIYFWLTSIVVIILTAVVAGSYPALYLSSFRPVKVLKGTFKAGRLAAIPRKVLVVTQFTVSVTLIVCTIIVYRQIEFAKNRPVGYSRESLVSIPTSNGNIHGHFEAVKDELTRAGIISEMAESESPTTGIWNTTSGVSWPGKDPSLSTDIGVVTASSDYGKTVHWELKEGRNFSKDFSDSSSFILNEAAVHFMGLKDPVGTQITWWGKPYTIVGVVKNMVIESPYDNPGAVVYSLSKEPGNMALLKLNPSITAKDAIAKIEPVFKKFSPDEPFEYHFVDEEYAKKFDNERRVEQLAGVFAVLAVVISCLGLFGLTSFVAEQRKKEIGVRKVLGASVLSVWNLLSKDFVMLVLVSFIVAFPLAYFFMHSWLQHYEYRTTISWWIFAAAGLGAMLITLLTISFQSIKAAIANPVKSLRTE